MCKIEIGQNQPKYKIQTRNTVDWKKGCQTASGCDNRTFPLLKRSRATSRSNIGMVVLTIKNDGTNSGERKSIVIHKYKNCNSEKSAGKKVLSSTLMKWKKILTQNNYSLDCHKMQTEPCLIQIR